MTHATKYLGRQVLKLLCIFSLATPAFAWTDAGYLPAVGPAPLRYFTPPRPSVPPPKPPPEHTDVGATAPAQIPMPNPLFPDPFATPWPAQPEPVQPVLVQPQLPAPAGQTNGATEPLAPSDVVSPQMLMQYFSKSGNGTATSIIAPVSAPPSQSAPPAPPSSATYSH